jgi:hypothetical protein
MARKGAGWKRRDRQTERQAAPPAPPSTAEHAPTERGHRRSAVAAAIAGTLAVVVGLSVVLVARGTTRQDRVAGSPGGASAGSYRVVYRVDDSVTSPSQVQTETVVLDVKRPDHLRLEHREGPPPGGRLLEGSVVNREDSMSLPDDYAISATPLTIPNELQVFSEPVLRAAVLAGKAESLGPGTVNGRQCLRYLYRNFGTEALSRGTDQDHVETCVTTDSIMLREAITSGGRQVRQVEAVELDRGPDFAPDTFVTTDKKPNPLADTEQVAEGPPDTEAKVVHGPAPTGFQMDWNVTNVLRDTQSGLSLPFYIERFTQGADFILTEQSLHGVAEVPWTTTAGDEVDLGGGRKGRLLYHTGYAEVQTTVAGSAVRVLASRPTLAIHEAERLHV